MASGFPTQSPSPSAIPALVPQGQHTGKPSMPMGRPFTLVGARHRAHLHLLSRSVSKSHAIIINDNGSLYVRDTASREHVYVNGELVKETELRHGDLIRIGSFTFKLVDGSGKSGRTVVPRPNNGALDITGHAIPSLIEGRTLVIGRRPTCDVVLSELAVSNVHAVIFELDGQHYIRDLGSRTGTFVNGQQIHQQALNFEDQIRIGDHEMRFAPGGVDSAIDELEHLVGTATLGSEQMTLASADAARAAAAMRADEQNEDTIPLAEPEHIIPLQEDRPAEDVRAVAQVQPAGGDLAELDLDADPDVSGSGDTHAMAIDPRSDTPRMPILSSQVVDDGGLPDEVGIETEERHLLVGDLYEEEKLTASGSFANMAHDEEDEDANIDFDLTDFTDETPAKSSAGVIPAAKDLHEAVVEKHVDTMYFDPEPAAAAGAHEAETIELSPGPDHVTASSSETMDAAAESSAGSPVVPHHAMGSLPEAIELEPATDELADWLAEGAGHPETFTAAEPMDSVLADHPEPLSTEDLADRYLAAPLMSESLGGAEPVETATAASSFAQPAVLHGPESAGFADGAHETFQHEPTAHAGEAWEDESTGDEDAVAAEEHAALMGEPFSGHEQSAGAANDPFGGEVPPPFPAGMAPVTASGAVGLPSWSGVRAETARVRKPLADAETHPTGSNGSSVPSNEPREVFDQTEPTPESAQHLEVQIGDTWAEAYAELMPGVDDLSDSKFGLVMQDFAGSALGALVENQGAEHVEYGQTIEQPLPAANAMDSEQIADAAQVTASPPMEFALTAHESMALRGDVDQPADVLSEETADTGAVLPEHALTSDIGVDSTSDSADASLMNRAVEESPANIEAMLASQGFLPEPDGDDLVA